MRMDRHSSCPGPGQSCRAAARSLRLVALPRTAAAGGAARAWDADAYLTDASVARARASVDGRRPRRRRDCAFLAGRSAWAGPAGRIRRGTGAYATWLERRA